MIYLDLVVRPVEKYNSGLDKNAIRSHRPVLSLIKCLVLGVVIGVAMEHCSVFYR